MRNWKFWDWTAYTCLGVAAIGMAVGETLKENPAMFERLPTFLLGPKWAYAPIILFAFGSAILAVRVIVPLAAQLPVAAERVLVDSTPEYLLSLGNGRTTIERNRITGVYLGKWLNVSGAVKNVNAAAGHGAIVRISIDNTKEIALLFNAQWYDRVTILRIGQNIAAIGQIKEIYLTEVELANCELMELVSK
jgi:hypothetical protein